MGGWDHLEGAAGLVAAAGARAKPTQGPVLVHVGRVDRAVAPQRAVGRVDRRVGSRVVRPPRTAQHHRYGDEDAELDDSEALPNLPDDCAGGDVGENVYTYRDMVPVPLESVGRAHCALKLAGSEQLIRVQAGAVTLELEDVAKYIEHLRPE